ncbi:MULTISPECIES: hypothetical protein [Cellulomonas]|uniref:Uncharacterized protein n=1 Tax=Cellulomonas oligotrophica TaxID=931536 RepID=A0A7Y9JY26_9CELL|nr:MULTISPECIES: hypothetical protein [Cellulomonas]NYD87378.1 hypothetical protein [Cellulomonas oligotrophica]TQL01498.1 hypothetical protein FBY24_0550 [Cellulomonas sp. SLBN-39]GIG34534.1 hypothetical protein Col01nite_36930 [Cellulomonas oligotrophica]
MNPHDPANGVRAYLDQLDGSVVRVRTVSGGVYEGTLQCLMSGNVVFVGQPGAAPCIRIDVVESVQLLQRR